MYIEMHDKSPEITIEDGAPVLSFYFTDIGPLDEKMQEFVENVDVGDGETAISVGVPLSEIVDQTIEDYRLTNYPDRVVVSDDNRALFEAIKFSLTAALAKIDLLEYD